MTPLTPFRTPYCLSIIIIALITTASSSDASSATWLSSPADNIWINPSNWTAGGPPNDPADTASFATSDQTNIVVSAVADLQSSKVSQIKFLPGASPYTIAVNPLHPLLVYSGGIENNSGIMQNFVTEPDQLRITGGFISITDGLVGSNTTFTNLGGINAGNYGGSTVLDGEASAGFGNFFMNGGNGHLSDSYGGFIIFSASSTAGNATFTMNTATVNFGHGGTVQFSDDSSGGNGTFIIKAGESSASDRGYMQFFGHATAGEGHYDVQGPTMLYGLAAVIYFRQNASGGSGIFTVHGSADLPFAGSVVFLDNTTAGSGAFTLVPGTVTLRTGAGAIVFYNSSNAGSATFAVNNAQVVDASGTRIEFFDGSNANHAAFTINQIPSPNANVAIRARTSPLTVPIPGKAEGATFETDGGAVYFWSNSNAGSASFIAYGGAAPDAAGGAVYFADETSADTGVFTLRAGEVSHAFGAIASFSEFSRAGSGQFTLEGATVVDALNARAEFLDLSRAGTSTFIVNGGQGAGANGSLLQFLELSTAENATLIANAGSADANGGGKIIFAGHSSGGTSRVEIFGNAELDLGLHTAGTVTVGSIEGDGNIILGDCNLSVGANNRTTTFAGRIQNDGPSNNIEFNLTKTGSGELSLTSFNPYFGGTAITSGILKALHDGALGFGNVNLAAGATLVLQGGTNTNYIADSATLTIASGAMVELNYSDRPEVIGFLVVDGAQQTPGLYGSASSGAPNPLPQLSGNGTLLVVNPQAFSRKMHSSGIFDVRLPFVKTEGIECRSGDANGDYQLIVSFARIVSLGSALVTSGIGSVQSTSGNNTTVLTINLTGVTNAQRIIVTLSDVNYGANVGDLMIPINILVGDTSGNGVVNASDVSQTKARAGSALDSSNFRSDVTANGTINASDVSLVKSKSGTSLPQ